LGELTIKIEIKRDKLAEVLVEGYNADASIKIEVTKAFEPCIIEDDYLIIKQIDVDSIISEVKISIGELGYETIYALVYELLRRLKDQDDKANKESLLYGIIEQFGSFNLEQANEFILKILEMVE
jgi:hypothetical protein